ncbi:galactonate dehydratase [Salinibacterium sp. NSLL150]|uniref:galactonate dehydratase n=1 Tax=unclassified Salinibacterium TaxID=2632331 RepID=UPI0018CEA651|nr:MULTISPECIES: galactonate dehydratase [unclassified Salinibacterium]MBH0097546.1 galactonate dehydratase [Salinibacterium sp. NSLL35]MBH0100301.1 galactonate dehydratase [Salinibacterium sp. NSLL150]MBH0103060.1 galactonate dehydratase [Salinibacterium sp. NSLL16]MBH0105821.1 galactonate dehydratase [Salinibacterium sp. NSLL17]
MKIARIETFLVPPRWLFVRIETDSGIVGWGEPVVEGQADIVRAAVEQHAEYLVGLDATRIEDHWQVLTRGGFYRGGPVASSAIAGIDQALWDIAGKAHGVPVHDLLGGAVRDRIRMYGWVGGDEPSELRDNIAQQVESGLTAIKMNASGRMSPLSTVSAVSEVVDRAALAREVLGPDRDFAIDFHGRMTAANSRRILPLLEPHAPLFVEEPVVPDKSHLLDGIVSSTSIPIATGERLFSRNEFLGPLQAGIAVVQPDLSHAGGISEVRRIAALADMFDAQLAPHCPLGPIALASSLQVGFNTPNFLIQEQSIGIHYNVGSDVLEYLMDTSVFDFTSGYIERLTKPGLGIDIDEAAVRAADKIGHQWRSPVWRHDDGSLAEW